MRRLSLCDMLPFNPLLQRLRKHRNNHPPALGDTSPISAPGAQGRLPRGEAPGIGHTPAAHRGSRGLWVPEVLGDRLWDLQTCALGRAAEP